VIDLYDFVAELNRLSQPDDIICPSASGYGCLVALQEWRLKPGQRFTTNFVFGQMGAGLSTAIGATLATGRRVLLIEGDGGWQLNFQELATVRRLNLPIIMFVLNNNGYHSIREMQKNRFDGRLVACDDTSGLELPRLGKMAQMYEFDYCAMRFPEPCYLWNIDNLEDGIEGEGLFIDMIQLILTKNRQTICEVMIDHNQQYRHRVKSEYKDGKWEWQPLESVDD